ncbi:MAG: DEAD/DEAH box helicase [Clostridium sp.]|uniref:DEAD/DEAH box helicase n=1 Tax=Clostridium sp. TaxID=1506 RepID=UPI0025C70F5E|nr:DEAD/DEAH box helicase [Clostridium sp.]MCE5221385.1 DEAD/DEAH box helicase [Clostridium sp.]
MIILKESDLLLVNMLVDKYTRVYIKKEFLKLNVNSEINADEMKIGLGLANIMSFSEKFLYQKLALRYATIISSVSEDNKILIKCNNILSNLTIFTFENVLRKRKGYDKNLVHYKGISLFEELYKKEFFSKNFAGKKEILNRFQLSTSNALKNVKNISISAPTSIGKSFLMKKIIIDQLVNTQTRKIVYIVPTRALINEVMNDIQNEIVSLNLDERIFVTCSSELNDEMVENKVIFILTQERLNQLCSNASEFNLILDLLIVDEAQQIAEGARGILLEYTIKRAKQLWRNIKIFFVSPLIENPEVFIKRFELENTYYRHEKLSTVNQNVITLEEDSKDSDIKIKYKDKTISSFEYRSKSFRRLEDRIAYVINKFNNDENSIIYCNIPSSTRKISNKLAKQKNFPKLNIIELDEFSDFLKKYICEEYDLADLIQRGVAYHYSKLPSIIKNGVEDLAKDGKLKIISCTSTLLEGINVQANNIYIYNPKKNTEFLSNLEFWNLSGRAGRMNNDLCGNIICINFKSDWYNSNYARRKIEDIEFKKNKMISEELNQFKSYIENKETIKVNRNNKEVIVCNENLESILLLEKIDGQNIVEKYLDKSNDILEIDSILAEKINNNEAPKELLKRLVGIDIVAINILWNTFIKNYNSIELYFLLNPFFEEADKRFGIILGGINKIFFNGKYTDKQLNAIKITGLKWMREKNIREIIFYDFSPSEYTSSEINEKIQDRLGFLNEEIRFTINKYLYAYQEILKEVLKLNGGELYIEKLCNYSLYLEFGASKKTTLELMYLGIFREGAISLSNYIFSEEPDKIRSELKALDIKSLKINSYIKKKIMEKLSML